MNEPAYQSELSILQETLRTALVERDALQESLTREGEESSYWKERLREANVSRDALNKSCLDYENEIAAVCQEDHSLKETFDALKVENAELRADREQFQHVCETQRVAIARLKKLCGENARGSDGFGSTDTAMKEPTR